MITYYSSKEFAKKFSEWGELQDFFKRIDRNTASEGAGRKDFFRFYKVPQKLIKDENSKRYRIPFESASLLAGMIRSYPKSYGADQRSGKSAFSYERYHQYIETMKNEIEKMEPFQKELIKNCNSYVNTMTTDMFLPIMTERIAMLLTALFCYQPYLCGDNFIETIRRLDDLIEGLFRRRIEDKHSLGSRSKPQEFTFEDAISNVCRLLSDDKYNISDLNEVSVSSLDLMKTVRAVRTESQQKAKNNSSMEDVEKFRSMVIDQLNQSVMQFYETHQNCNQLHEENMLHELELCKSFWTSESFLQRFLLSEQNQTKKEIERLVDIIGECYPSVVLIEESHHASDIIAGIEDVLKQRASDALTRNDLYELRSIIEDLQLYDTYQSDTELVLDIVSEYGIGKSNSEIAEELTAKYNFELKEAGESQAAIHQDDYRKEICSYYQQTKQSEIFKNVQEALTQAVSQLLPTQLD